MKNNHKILIINKNTELHVGDYFKTHGSKYYVLIKEIALNQRYADLTYNSEYNTTFVKVDIFDKQERLIAGNSIVTIGKLISGSLSKYIPNLAYDPTYLGEASKYEYPAYFKIWKDMVKRCYDCYDSVFPYIGGVGTTLCDRWRCFEYFVIDIKHMIGYAEAGDKIHNRPYIVDLYDIQKHIHPYNRVYAPGYVKLKPFKSSDICKYYNKDYSINPYPKDLITTEKYKRGEINIIETLFKKQTGMVVKLNLDICDYYYNHSIGYQPIAAMINPYASYTYAMYYGVYNPYMVQAYNAYYNDTYHVEKAMKEMCTVVRKE